MDLNLARRILHDLKLIKDEDKSLRLSLGITIWGEDRKELYEFSQLTFFLIDVLNQLVKEEKIIHVAERKIKEDIEKQRDSALNLYNKCDNILEQYCHEEEKEQ